MAPSPDQKEMVRSEYWNTESKMAAFSRFTSRHVRNVSIYNIHKLYNVIKILTVDTSKFKEICPFNRKCVSIRTTETKFYEPARLSTPPKLLFH